MLTNLIPISEIDMMLEEFYSFFFKHFQRLRHKRNYEGAGIPYDVIIEYFNGPYIDDNPFNENLFLYFIEALDQKDRERNAIKKQQQTLREQSEPTIPKSPDENPGIKTN